MKIFLTFVCSCEAGDGYGGGCSCCRLCFNNQTAAITLPIMDTNIQILEFSFYGLFYGISVLITLTLWKTVSGPHDCTNPLPRSQIKKFVQRLAIAWIPFPLQDKVSPLIRATKNVAISNIMLKFWKKINLKNKRSQVEKTEKKVKTSDKIIGYYAPRKPSFRRKLISNWVFFLIRRMIITNIQYGP